MDRIIKAYNSIKEKVSVVAENIVSENDNLNENAWYAQRSDSYITNILENKLIQSYLCKVANDHYGEQLDELLKRSTPLDDTSFPMLYQVYLECCSKLKLNNSPSAYITSALRGINALSLEVNNQQLILISRAVCYMLSAREQAFILGHELGHHQQSNLVCHTVIGLIKDLSNFSSIFGKELPDAVFVPMMQWCRDSEFNADRAGYICSQDIDSIRSLFRKAMPNATNTASDKYKEISYAHPLVATRLEKLHSYTGLRKDYQKFII